MKIKSMVAIVSAALVMAACGGTGGGTGGGSGGAAGGGTGGSGGGSAGGGTGGGSTGGGTGGGSTGGGTGGGSTGGGTGGGSAGGGTGGGSAGTACAADFANCGSTFTDLTGMASPTINWANLFGAPGCFKVKASQMVKFSVVDGTHPLIQACGPAQVITGTKMADVTQQFSTTGKYGVYCPNHSQADGKGMGAAIQVVP